MAIDKELLSVIQGLRGAVEEYGNLQKSVMDNQSLILEKQDVYDKSLKELEDNFYNQSPRTHYSSPDVSYGTAGKDQDREDMKGENTKPADVSTVKKSGRLAADARKILAKSRLAKHDVSMGGVDEEEDDDMYTEDDVLEDDDDMEKGYRMSMGENDDEEEGDYDLKDLDMHGDDRDDEIKELREMLKQAMMMMKSQNGTTTMLMKKLEEISKQQNDKDDVILPSKMLVHKSVDTQFGQPIRQLGGTFMEIMQDRDGVITDLMKGAISKKGDISEGAFLRLNHMRKDLGDLDDPNYAVYDTGVVGM